MWLHVNQPFRGGVPHRQGLLFQNVRTGQPQRQNQYDYDDVSPEELVRGVGYETAR